MRKLGNIGKTRLVCVLLLPCVLLAIFHQIRVALRFDYGHTWSLTHPEANAGVYSNFSVAELSLAKEHRVEASPRSKGSDHVVLQIRAGLRSAESLNSNSIPVVLWPLMDPANIGKAVGKAGTSPDVTHIQENGVLGSSVLTLANESIRTFAENVVWVTDSKFPKKIWCSRLHQKVLVTQERRKAQGLSTTWPIFVVDFTDKPRYQSCKALEDALGSSWIFYSKRSTVTNRSWSFETNWLKLGQQLPKVTAEGRHYEQTPLIVRSDIVEAIDQLTAEKLNKSDTVLENISIEEAWVRSVDVAHYWPATTKPSDVSNLRNLVSHNLKKSFSQNYNVFCDMVGMADRVGRRHPQLEYVRALLDTKIVVVAQRDTYEDHYRLYEALVSGGLVLTDPMLTLPNGLRNGTSIIVYSTLDDLVQQVQYFLNHNHQRIKIAKAGRRVALARHRSWHRMEEVILGRIVST